MQSGAFEAYDNGKIEVNLRQPVSSFFFLWKSAQSTRILVKSSNVHCSFIFRKLVYMRSVTSETALRAF